MAQSDLYQVFAYAKAYQLQDVALVYPQSASTQVEQSGRLYFDGSTRLHVLFVDITLTAISRQAFREVLLAGLGPVLEGALAHP